MWNRFLVRPLLRDPGEIARRAGGFAIATDHGRDLVARLGEAFIAGYNAMLTMNTPAAVAASGGRIDPHFRPFFFEGAAMGYLPRGILSARYRRRRAEADLMGMDARYRYLYYVGLGFWYGLRHPRRPSALSRLEPHLDPMYFPLCHDGYGFKVGFFDYPQRPGARDLLDRLPPQQRAAAHQGFGRALFFVYMDDEEGFRREQDRGDSAHRADMEIGRSLALAFTGLDRPDSILAHLNAARGADDLGARLTGVTWALAAREMNDANYFRCCLGRFPAAWQGIFGAMPSICNAAFAAATDYRDWQEKTAVAVVHSYPATS